jgi:hypothetical protein
MRYRLRTLLIVFTLVAIAGGLASNRYRARNRALKFLQQSGAVINFERLPEWFPVSVQNVIPIELLASVREVQFHQLDCTDEMLAATLMLDVSRISFVETSVRVPTCQALARSTNLEDVAFCKTQIEPGAVREIARSKSLERIRFYRSSATDADCRDLAHCGSLQSVDVNADGITDEGLAAIASLPNLSTVFLSPHPITQAGIERLLESTRLNRLYCFGAPFPDEWWAAIKVRHPHCKIHR